jgi:hypothetical protein
LLGFYENFPSSIQMSEAFNTTLSSKQLQQKLIKVFFETNKKNFSFEEVANPTFPDSTVIFEFGLADNAGFTFIDEQETEKVFSILMNDHLQTVDFFCGIRYYKGKQQKKTPLKFDYYLIRTIYGKERFEVQIHHERGPRYLSPEDLTQFIFNKLNEGTSRKPLKKTNQ